MEQKLSQTLSSDRKWTNFRQHYPNLFGYNSCISGAWVCRYAICTIGCREHLVTIQGSRSWWQSCQHISRNKPSTELRYSEACSLLSPPMWFARTLFVQMTSLLHVSHRGQSGHMTPEMHLTELVHSSCFCVVTRLTEFKNTEERRHWTKERGGIWLPRGKNRSKLWNSGILWWDPASDVVLRPRGEKS